MERCWGWSSESSCCEKLTPLEMSLTWAYSVTLLLWGFLSSGFLDPLLIRLLVKNSYSTRAFDVVYAHPGWEHKTTPLIVIHLWHILGFCLVCCTVYCEKKSCLMRHQGLSSCHKKLLMEQTSYWLTHSRFIQLNLLLLPTLPFFQQPALLTHSLFLPLSFCPAVSLHPNVSVVLPASP